MERPYSLSALFYVLLPKWYLTQSFFPRVYFSILHPKASFSILLGQLIMLLFPTFSHLFCGIILLWTFRHFPVWQIFRLHFFCISVFQLVVFLKKMLGCAQSFLQVFCTYFPLTFFYCQYASLYIISVHMVSAILRLFWESILKTRNDICPSSWFWKHNI